MTRDPYDGVSLPSDPVAASLGIRVSAIEPGRCTARMRVRPDMLNALGSCHGGILFTLADSACGYAANFGAQPTVAASGTIEFVAAVRAGDDLVATASGVWQGGRNGLFDIEIRREDGVLVAALRSRTYRLGPAR